MTRMPPTCIRAPVASASVARRMTGTVVRAATLTGPENTAAALATGLNSVAPLIITLLPPPARPGRGAYNAIHSALAQGVIPTVRLGRGSNAFRQIADRGGDGFRIVSGLLPKGRARCRAGRCAGPDRPSWMAGDGAHAQIYARPGTVRAAESRAGRGP